MPRERVRAGTAFRVERRDLVQPSTHGGVALHHLNNLGRPCQPVFYLPARLHRKSVVVSVATAAATTADYPDDRVPLTLTPDTTGRPMRDQATQCCPRVCAEWG